MNAAENESPSPTQAWAQLRVGNTRFVADTPHHPRQDDARRRDTVAGQHPIAALFGCSDSRVSPELIFDQGLGDLFVVRTAGHVAGPIELGSLEFAVGNLAVPLIVVLGHESCGAVGAARVAVSEGRSPAGHLGNLVELLTPSVVAADRRGETSAQEAMHEHVRQTMHALAEQSPTISEGLRQSTLAIVGGTYALANGHITVLDHLGDITFEPAG